MIRDTLWGVLTVSLVCGVMLQLCPKNGKLVPYIQFLVSLVLLLMLLSPLMTVLTGLHIDDPTALLLSDVTAENGGDYYAKAVTDGAAARAASALASLISAETGIGVQEMEVALTTETADGAGEIEVTVTAVTVTLYHGTHRIASGKITALVERTLLCPCTVTVKEGEHA